MGGVSKARNTGMGIAKGGYIAFVDSDDYVDNNFLKKLYNENFDLTVCSVLFVDFPECKTRVARQETDCEELVSDANIKKWYEQESLYSVWTCLFKRSIIIENNICFDIKTSRGEDTIFMFEYISKCKNAKFISDLLYYYVRYGGNTLTTTLNNSNITSLDYLDTYLHNWFSIRNIFSEKLENPYYWTKNESREHLMILLKNTDIPLKIKYTQYRSFWNTNIFQKWRHTWFKEDNWKMKIMIYAPSPVLLIGYDALNKLWRAFK